VEHFTINKQGIPCNAHPLSVQEANRLARSLEIADEKNFLTPKSMLGTEILSFDPIKSKVIWYTKAQVRQLYFTSNLGLNDGSAFAPPMLWIADRQSLYVFALLSNRRPVLNTEIYHAPFFNIYESGNVCMGTVDINLQGIDTVEEFTRTWEDYFFQSRFRHLTLGHNPINGNCVQLWEQLLETGQKFPLKVLIKTKFKLKDVL